LFITKLWLSASSILLLDPKKTVSASSDPCTDSLDICPKWKENGFCSSQFYSKSYRASICRKSCTMC
uniref:ShKT domain-containing protein n=1 Tax=Rhabditophanes sp. KR3021 TaxID=114890 RepID=A0AC35TFZ2_9BILA